VIFFTSDEHYWHKNIIKFCERPFESVREMNETLVQNHNSIVNEGDTVFHLGDFVMSNDRKVAETIIASLKGNHVFTRGDHDRWMGNQRAPYIMIDKFDGHTIVMCHWCMHIWPKSHYNSWHIFGHSHGRLIRIDGKRYDVGVDNNGFFPVSLIKLKEIMNSLPDNRNFVGRFKKGKTGLSPQ